MKTQLTAMATTAIAFFASQPAQAHYVYHHKGKPHGHIRKHRRGSHVNTAHLLRHHDAKGHLADIASPLKGLTADTLEKAEKTLSNIYGSPEDNRDGFPPQPPPVDYSGQKHPYKMAGTITINGKQFPFISGGHGRGSIPYGDYPITKSSGSWGERHGALGLNNQTIPDKPLGKDREGIEIHAGNKWGTEGCVGITKGYDELKKTVVAMIDEVGKAFLHVSPAGAAITETKTPPDSRDLLPVHELIAPVQVAKHEEQHKHIAHLIHRRHYAHTHHHYRHYAELEYVPWFWY